MRYRRVTSQLVSLDRDLKRISYIFLTENTRPVERCPGRRFKCSLCAWRQRRIRRTNVLLLGLGLPQLEIITSRHIECIFVVNTLLATMNHSTRLVTL